LLIEQSKGLQEDYPTTSAGLKKCILHMSWNIGENMCANDMCSLQLFSGEANQPC